MSAKTRDGLQCDEVALTSKAVVRPGDDASSDTHRPSERSAGGEGPSSRQLGSAIIGPNGDGRTHIASTLMRESLVDRRVVASTDSQREFQILPDVTLVGLGGHSIFDRGKDALVPLAEELAVLRRQHKMVLGVGGGTRVRHTVAIALDLGLPTGGIAQLVGAMEEANAVFLNALLAKHGSIVMQREHFWELPLYLESGMLPIVISIPPYHFWEPPPEDGPLPAHGSDFGLFIHAEVLGMQRLIFVKDEDGLYDRDPKMDAGANLIRRTTLTKLLEAMPSELILDRQLFQAWRTARHVRKVQIVNGLKRGQLARALAGEDVGTVIEKTDAHSDRVTFHAEVAR